MNKSVFAVVLACLVLMSTFSVAEPPGPSAGRTDALGDLLPPDAILRLGGTRLRHPDRIEALVFSPDGKLLASADHWGLVRMGNGGRQAARRVQQRPR